MSHAKRKEKKTCFSGFVFSSVNYRSHQLKSPTINLKPVWISANPKVNSLLCYLVETWLQRNVWVPQGPESSNKTQNYFAFL